MSIDMCVDKCIDKCVDMCIDMCIRMESDMSMLTHVVFLFADVWLIYLAHLTRFA